MIPSKVH